MSRYNLPIPFGWFEVAMKDDLALKARWAKQFSADAPVYRTQAS